MSESVSLDAGHDRALDDWAYIVIDDTTFPCSARRIGLASATIENVVVAVGERLKLFVHLPTPCGGVAFLALSGQVSSISGHRAEIAITRMDESSRAALAAWMRESDVLDS